VDEPVHGPTQPGATMRVNRPDARPPRDRRLRHGRVLPGLFLSVVGLD
jgi:hypothetical protein